MSARYARQAQRPTRCNYCQKSAVVWLRLRGYISPNIRPRTGGAFTMYAAACAEHEGCVNWQGVLQNHPEAERVTAKAEGSPS